MSLSTCWAFLRIECKRWSILTSAFNVMHFTQERSLCKSTCFLNEIKTSFILSSASKITRCFFIPVEPLRGRVLKTGILRARIKSTPPKDRIKIMDKINSIILYFVSRKALNFYILPYFGNCFFNQVFYCFGLVFYPGL